ncbi:glycoside hydrolase family 95 protein [Cohnella candidum]|uniref:Glycoside hydrolase family 95 protein n=1 Tax=Cohnella candidum TaxID=2674991 RepID=A0A3G3K641_9BACL|nr:glycoside hydrolase family 95 protein [Cohnella candidum]AYQ75239.1 glycoside hydrolase family 95 protein [Cohnella candidum]
MGETKLRYDGPADKWAQGLPVGNGRLGAVIYGGADRETWSVTESTYWSGKPERTPAKMNGKADLEEMRRCFFAGDYARGEELAGQLLQPEKGNFGTNLPLCAVHLTFGHIGGKLQRELDLEDAAVRLSYEAGGTAYCRETFATHADGVLVSRIRSDGPDKVSFTLRLEAETERFEAWPDGDTLAFSGQATERIHSDGECGVSCRGVVMITASGGTVAIGGNGIAVRNAEEAVIWLSVATDYGQDGELWADEAERRLRDAVAKGFARVKEDHLADYRPLFGRVSLDLGDAGRTGLPLDHRLRLLREDAGDDPGLYELFFQYGRYLMIAGSREDSPLPLHLQGIWNDGEANRMAWSCDYHLDVNTEMNYYPTEACNLAESHVPLMRFVERLAEAGREAARDFYGSEGWVAHVFTNAWGFSAPGWHYSWGLNVTGGLWIAAQLREHYEYNLDGVFLKETAYPVLKEAALFFLDYMTVHPVHGWLVTGPSNSPENSFYADASASSSYALSMGSTMDQQLVRDLFDFCLSAAERLRVDTEFQERLRRAIVQLPPLQIGRKGQLQEWLEDYGEAQPDHRHLAHLWALYPGSQITPEETPDLAEAARVTLDNRMRGEGLEDVEFTLALFAASYARLGDAEKARDSLSYLVGQLCFDNLLTYSKPGIAGAETNIFVVDGNFGGTSAIAEMLLQSRAGDIHLLPAMPAGWPTGRFTGLRAKGNAEVSAAWENGELTEAVIRPFSTLRTRLRYGGRTVTLELEPGREYAVDRDLRITER